MQQAHIMPNSSCIEHLIRPPPSVYLQPNKDKIRNKHFKGRESFELLNLGCWSLCWLICTAELRITSVLDWDTVDVLLSGIHCTHLTHESGIKIPELERQSM